MRRQLIVLPLLFLAAACQGYVELRPKEMTVQVGHTTTAGAYFVSTPPHWPAITRTVSTFVTDQPGIVSVTGDLQPDQAYAPIMITALQPGVANIFDAAGGSVGTTPMMTVIVRCDELVHVSPALPIVTTILGEPVTLRVTTSGIEHPGIHWFAGVAGDPLHPFSATGPILSYTPSFLGTQYVWAHVQGECSDSEVEFRVDVLKSTRRRAAR